MRMRVTDECVTHYIPTERGKSKVIRPDMAIEVAAAASLETHHMSTSSKEFSWDNSDSQAPEEKKR